jgi:DNA-binding response OmpR family regulator
MNENILLIEDNIAIHRILAEVLSREGFVVRSAYDGRTGLRLFQDHEVDLLVLDLMLPDIDGEKVLADVRARGNLPVLIISAKDTDVDKAIHLGLGADDYLAKPFSMIELIARVKALLRRASQSNAETPAIRCIGDVVFHTKNFEVTKDGERIPLTLKEAKIIELLLTHPNTTFSKKEIYEAVWKEEYYHDDNVLNVHIRRIREKIETDPSDPQIIRTVWGVGYRYEDPTVSVSDAQVTNS